MAKMIYSLSISHPDYFDHSIKISIFLFQERPSKEHIIASLESLKCSTAVNVKLEYTIFRILNVLNKYPIPDDDIFVISTEIFTIYGIQPGIIKLVTVPLF